jgi:transposase
LFYCGIDIAKRNHEASVINAEGKPLLDSITITNTQEGCGKLFSLFERLNIARDSVIIGMEATGHYWLSVYEYLTEQKYDVRVINPIQSDAFRKMYIRPDQERQQEQLHHRSGDAVRAVFRDNSIE